PTLPPGGAFIITVDFPPCIESSMENSPRRLYGEAAPRKYASPSYLLHNQPEGALADLRSAGAPSFNHRRRSGELSDVLILLEFFHCPVAVEPPQATLFE